MLIRCLLLCWLALLVTACDEPPEAEATAPEGAAPARPSTRIAGKLWLDVRDRTPPEQWLASREAGADVAASAAQAVELRALLARADRRYGETPRMIANRAVQLEEMLAERGIEETARRIIEGLVRVGRENDPRGFGETGQHYFNIRATGMSREEALLSLETGKAAQQRER